MTTIAQQQRQEWLSKIGAVMCHCGRDKIVYRCYHEGCQLNKNFCVECKDDDIHKHASSVVRCFEVISKSDNRWSLINERYDKSVKAAITSY